ncbi:MAG: hypothetical protein ABR875_00705 [Minisyncoccia bacterium]|jgi:hypothetical protein
MAWQHEKMVKYFLPFSHVPRIHRNERGEKLAGFFDVPRDNTRHGKGGEMGARGEKGRVLILFLNCCKIIFTPKFYHQQDEP